MTPQTFPLYVVPSDEEYGVGLVVGWHQPDTRSAPRPVVVPLDRPTGCSPAAESARRKFAFFTDMPAALAHVEARR